MNQEQTRYAINRVNELLKQAKESQKQKFTIPEKSLSSVERYKLLSKGKVKLKKDIYKIEDYHEVKDIFDFSAYESDESVSEKYHQVVSELENKASSIKDEIMLGDDEKALRLLQSFTEFVCKKL